MALSFIAWATGHLRRNAVPLLVWLAAIAAAGRLFAYRSSTCELTGVANPDQRDVAALTNGRLRLVPVELFEPVKEGQPIVVLEDERIQAALATAAAEAARLRSELVAAESRLAVEAGAQQAEHMADARRYAVDVERSRLRELELQVATETNRARLEFLQLQRDLLGRLHAQRAISELRFKSAEADFKVAQTSISENEKALSQARDDLQQARHRQDGFAATHVESRSLQQALAPLRDAVTVQERRMDELAMERSWLVLKSPMDGVVSQRLRGAGESVRTGEAIVTIASTRPSSITVYATSAQVPRFQPGSRVRLELPREGVGRHAVTSRVRAVGPQAEQIPARLWRSPSTPGWGWPVSIAIPRDLQMLCGEVIAVSRR